MDPAAKILDPMMPDLANPPQVRKRRAPKHDFKDGKGRVFAHRHDNGGGWVADTAWVAPTAKVTRNAQVFDYARVHDNCEITGQARVFNRARLFDSVVLSQRAAVHGLAMVRNSATVKDNCQIFGSAHVCGNTHLNNNVHIYDHAVVINSNLCGPRRQDFFGVVRGAARVLNSRFHNWFSVSDASLLENAHIQNVVTTYSARVVNSSVFTNISWTYHSWLNGQIKDLPENHAPYNADSVIQVVGTVINSAINTTPWRVHERAQFVNCTLMCAMTGLPTDNTALHDVLDPFDRAMVGAEARQLEAITNAVNRIMNPAAVAATAPIPAIAARGEANFEAVRQRRIMRMEET